MPKKKFTQANALRAAEELSEALRQGEFPTEPINIAKTVEARIAELGLEGAAKDAAKMLDYYRWAEDLDNASDWEDVARIIRQRQAEQSGT